MKVIVARGSIANARAMEGPALGLVVKISSVVDHYFWER